MKTELEILREVKFMFELQSDHSVMCNGYVSLCRRIEELEQSRQVDVSSSLPNDSETEKWFDENIGINSDCSASSAVYKFRLWLKERLESNKA